MWKRLLERVQGEETRMNVPYRAGKTANRKAEWDAHSMGRQGTRYIEVEPVDEPVRATRGKARNSGKTTR